MRDFDDLPRRRIPRQYSYVGSYRRPGSIEGAPIVRAGDILEGIEEVQDAFTQRRKRVNEYQKEAEQEYINLQELVDNTKVLDRPDFNAEMTKQFSQMVTDVYKAKIASFDGDQSDYLKKSSNAKKILNDYRQIMSSIYAEKKEWDDMNPVEKDKQVLRSQFIGPNAAKKKAYKQFLNDPSKMGVRIDNGELIITNDGKDLFNGTQFVNLYERGGSLVTLGDKYKDELETATKDANANLESLVETSKIEKAIAGGTEIETTVKNNYANAAREFIKRLEEQGKIDALLDESTFQRYTNEPGVYDASKHNALIKQNIIKQLVNDKYPMYNPETGEAFANIKTIVDVGAPISQGEQARLKFEKMKFTVDQIQTAKTEQELKKSIDFYLNRNLEHAAKVSKMPKNSKQRADETAKLLNEARGIDKLGFKALQGLINEDEKFEENSKSGKYYVLDADGALVQGVNDNIGLIDALNKETVYKNLNMDTRSKIKPYVTNRMANFSKKINAIENEVTEKVKGENTTIPTDPSEQVDYIIKLQDNKINNITLSDYNKYRNKIGLKSINQNEFDITHKPGLIQQYRLGGNEGDYGSIIQVISNEIDNYVNKNAGKKDPKSIL
jgi:hypothetical protein